MTSPDGTVNEGTVTFTLLQDGTPVGDPVVTSVSNGSATANYTLPGGTPAGSYTIDAAYNGTPDFAGSSDSGHALTVTALSITVTGASVGWGSQTVAR